jgi:hypothetical protein
VQPRRVVTRSRQVLRKAETLRTQEERGLLLYRLIARHWDLSLSHETESSPDHDEVSSAMRIRVYHLPTSASNATSSTTARVGGGSIICLGNIAFRWSSGFSFVVQKKCTKEHWVRGTASRASSPRPQLPPKPAVALILYM